MHHRRKDNLWNLKKIKKARVSLQPPLMRAELSLPQMVRCFSWNMYIEGRRKDSAYLMSDLQRGLLFFFLIFIFSADGWKVPLLDRLTEASAFGLQTLSCESVFNIGDFSVNLFTWTNMLAAANSAWKYTNCSFLAVWADFSWNHGKAYFSEV